MPEGKENVGAVTRLARGGVRVATGRGPLQYGATPETIKDSMALPGGVPEVFVVPPTLFSTHRGISLAELEFPAYFNFFVRKRKTTIVCRRSQMGVLKRLISESVFGPETVRPDADYPPAAPCVANLRAELDFFRKVPFSGARRMALADLVDFVLLDRQGKAIVLGGVEVALDTTGLCVREDGREIARVDAATPLAPEPLTVPAPRKHPFDPPLLGATTIGTGHGFDPKERTSGFILWVNRRGVLIDPPVDSTEWFTGNDLSPRLVESLILTHCHADHDAGTLQKVLQEGRVTIYTTRTVMSSFVRKYQPLSGLPMDRFLALFDFVPVRIGEPIRIHGAEFLFHYSLHSIPTVGFEVYFGGKSFAYTSDFLNDPKIIESMYQADVLSADRRDELLNFPWHHTVIFHEAGVPPIHTAVSFLADLPDEIKAKIFLVHTSRATLKPDSGLKLAPDGLDATLSVPVQPAVNDTAMEILDALAHIDLFRGMPLDKACDILAVSRLEEYPAGTRIIADGTPGDRFYVILGGRAVVRKGGKDVKVYTTYDYLGETAIILDQPRSADVVAQTDVRAVVIDRYDFMCLLRGTHIPAVFRRIAANRSVEAWAVLEEIPFLSGITAGQKTQLQAIMEREELSGGDVLCTEGQPVMACYLIERGELSLSRQERPVETLGRGRIVGDAVTSAREPIAPFTVRAKSSATVYKLPYPALRRFLDRNPGLVARLLAANPGA